MSGPINLSPAARSVLLALADDEHMVGSRHANWIGMGPFLEEDLAFCSIAQDELGHALALYEMFVPASGVDRFALMREPGEYRSCALAELACPTWDLALVRHWLYDHAEALRWQSLQGSSLPEVAALATQVMSDEQFHTTHADMFMMRVCADSDARVQVQAALGQVMPLVGSLWAPADLEGDALAEGVCSSPSSELAVGYFTWLEGELTSLGLTATLPDAATDPADRHVRSAGFESFHDDLREVISLDPAAIW